MIIGLTGQSGAGKSSVSRFFAKSGFGIVNADELAHKALKMQKCKESLKEAFGTDIFDSEGEVIRRALARAAFANEESTRKLNRCTHPTIAKLVDEEIASIKASKKLKGALLDAPTLFESGLDKICNSIICVVADKSIRANRIMKRDGLSRDDAMLRLNAQKGDDFYTKKSAIVIENNGSEEELALKVEKVIKELFDE